MFELIDNVDNIRKEVFDINEIRKILDEYALEKFRLTEKVEALIQYHSKEIKVVGNGFRIGR